ncbi:MAG: hypothetical protein ACK5RN_12380, partial [bacterium]
TPAQGVEVQVERDGLLLGLRCVVEGDVDRLAWPLEARQGRADDLWRHTCFEVFGRRQDRSYAEFNLSPSMAWAAYGFSGYRADMADLYVGEPRITFEESEGGFELTAILFWNEWPHLDAIGLSAVIETVGGAKSWWALNHPSDKPDFHHPESFALKSPVLGKP